MLRWYLISVSLICNLALSGQAYKNRDFLPPYNFKVDSVSLLATWESPKIILLDEDFQGDAFPPPGWTASSLGDGWLGADPPVFQYWIVPEHAGKFALSNDDAASYSNNGSMDYLVTPVMDLTVADSFRLFFDSYFDGGYGQRAYLEYSLDSGITWLQLKQLDASLEWQNLEIDLSQFSGPEGESDFQLTFHADDCGYDASGWAIDNVVVHSDQNPINVIGYKVFLDSEVIGQVDETSYQYSIEFTTIHNCGVMARYQNGSSDTVWQNIRSDFFPQPDSLTGVAPNDEVILSWVPPANTDYLIGYNIYRNGDFLTYVYCTEPGCCHYLDPIDWSEESYFLYEVTALYELSEYGFPGEIGESLPDGPAEITGCCWNELDFFENWSDRMNNYWKFSGDNWKVDQGIGNDAPAAVFSPDSVQFQYKDTLQSYMFLNTGVLTDIILEYDVSLSSVNPSGNEKLLAQVYDYLNQSWTSIDTLTNANGSFGWQRDTINITNVFNDGAFRIRFTAEGENSADINYWAIDNISVRREFYPPENVQASILSSSQDSILVSWEDPLTEIAEWREWDDGVQFDKVGFGVGKEAWCAYAVRWTPEQLAGLKDAKLTAIGFMPSDGETFYKAAIWKNNSVKPFYVQAAGNFSLDEWNIIQLDVPIPVDITKDLMVGFQFSFTGGYPLSVDDGPCIDDFSNLFQFGLNQPWTTLLEVNPDMDYNWNLRAYFERDGYPVTSYRLFRSLDGNEPEMIAELEDTMYIDPVSSGFTTSCYKVKSVYYDEYESGISNEACVIFTGSDHIEQENDGFLKIFPNPSDCLVSIESSENIEFISLYNSFGDVILKKKVDEKQLQIPVSAYPAGVYMIKVETEGRVISKKVMVVH